MSDDLSFADAHSLAGMVRDGDLSPVDLCKHFLQRIERYNPKLQAFLRVTADQALAAARSAETALAAGLEEMATQDAQYLRGLMNDLGLA